MGLLDAAFNPYGGGLLGGLGANDLASLARAYGGYQTPDPTNVPGIEPQFSPNAPQPQAQQPSILDKLGLLFSDPFGGKVPFAGGLQSEGSDLNRFAQLFTDPFGAKNPFPGAIGAPKGPSTNAADYAGLADAFGGGQLPPGAQPTSGAAPANMNPQAGPTLDQRAYGMPGQPTQLQPPTVMEASRPAISPQAAQAMAQAPQSPAPDFLKGLSNFSHNLGSTGGLGGVIDAIRGTQTGERYDAAGKAEKNQQTTMMAVAQSLVSRGYSPQEAMGMARAAAIDPKVAEKVLGDAYASPKNMEEFIARNAAINQRGGGQGQQAGDPMSVYEKFLRTKNRGEKAGTVEGERLANAQLDLQPAVAQANEALRLVGDLRSHKGREGNVWWHGKASNYLPDASIPGNTDAGDAVTILNQIKGGAFLEAFKALKGGGQITEVEGKKATDAIARMQRHTSKAEFDRALSDYEGVIRLGIDRANQQAGQPAPHGFKGNTEWQQVRPGIRIRQVQ